MLASLAVSAGGVVVCVRWNLLEPEMFSYGVKKAIVLWYIRVYLTPGAFYSCGNLLIFQSSFRRQPERHVSDFCALVFESWKWTCAGCASCPYEKTYDCPCSIGFYSVLNTSCHFPWNVSARLTVHHARDIFRQKTLVFFRLSLSTTLPNFVLRHLKAIAYERFPWRVNIERFPINGFTFSGNVNEKV